MFDRRRDRLALATPAPNYNVATGSDQLVLQVTTGGGLVPIEVQLTHTPWFALYGDGRVIVQGPVIAIYPAPLLPNLRQMQVTPPEIQKILAAADQAGLLGPDARFDAVDIYDASTTTFTTTVDGKTHTIRAYALGFNATMPDEAVAEAHKKLSGFSGEITDLAAFLGRKIGDAEAYDAAAMRVFTSPTDLSNPDNLKRQVVVWPLTADPGTAGEAANVPNTRCLVLTGPDLGPSWRSRGRPTGLRPGPTARPATPFMFVRSIPTSRAAQLPEARPKHLRRRQPFVASAQQAFVVWGVRLLEFHRASPLARSSALP